MADHRRLRGPMRRIAVGLALLIAFPCGARAQRALAPLRGIVVDSAGQPIESVEISATAVGRVVRTGTDGRFQIDTLVAGPNRLLAQRLGWKAIDTTFILRPRYPSELRFVMSRVSQQLAEVRIVSHDDCPIRTLEGFECRRRAGIGAFRDSSELAALNPSCLSEMAQGMEGLRLVGSDGSPCRRLEPTTGWRCLRTMIDGRIGPAQGRLKMSDYIGIEFYDDPDKVPEWYKEYAFAAASRSTKTRSTRAGGTAGPTVYGTPQQGGRECSLLVLWTQFAPRFDPSLDQDKNATRAMKVRRDSIAALQKSLIDSLAPVKKP